MVLQFLLAFPNDLYLSKILKVSNDLQDIYNDALNEICEEYKFSSKDELLNNSTKSNEHFNYFRYVDTFTLLSIRLLIPDIYEQILNHIELKDTLYSKLPDYFFRKKSSSNIYHLRTLNEVKNLYALYVSTQERASKTRNFLYKVDLTELNITNREYYELIRRIYSTTLYSKNDDNMYIADNKAVLQLCLKFRTDYPKLWEITLNDMKTNKEFSLFNDLYRRLYKDGWLDKYNLETNKLLQQVYKNEHLYKNIVSRYNNIITNLNKPSDKLFIYKE